MTKKAWGVVSLFLCFLLLISAQVRGADPEVEKMLGKLKEKVKANPADSKAQLELGMAYISLENFEEAAKCLQVAVDKDPKNQDARFLLGQSLNGTKKYKEAIAVLSNLIKEEPASDDKKYKKAAACRMLGDAHYQQGELNEALTALRTALESDQNDAETYYLMGIIYINLKQLDYAKQTAESLRTLDIDKARELDTYITNASE